MAQQVKNPPAVRDTGDVDSIPVGKFPCRRISTSVSCLKTLWTEEPGGWGCKEPDMTERLNMSTRRVVAIYLSLIYV